MITKFSPLVRVSLSLCIAFFALAMAPGKAASFIYNVTLSGLASGRFYTLDFHFNDGGDGTNNVASITHLNAGTGTALETPANFTLVDAYPDVRDIDFQPGNTVSFRLILTTNPNGLGTPADSFFLSLFDGAGSGGPVLEMDEPFLAGFSQIVTKPSLTLYGQTVMVTVSQAQPAIAKDFNSDGMADLVWENTVTGQRVIWLLNNGTFLSSMNLPAVPTQWEIAGVGDFLGDGQADLVWQNKVTGQLVIWVLNNGTFVSSINVGTVALQWRLAGAANFFGTLQAGLVFQNPATGQLVIWNLKDGKFLSSINLPTVAPQWHVAGAADFFDTGQAGLVFENAATGQRAIWNLKNGVFVSSINLPIVPSQWHIAGAADFNGNGQADLVWENTATGQRVIWFLNNGVLASSINLPSVSTLWQIRNH